MGNFHIFKKKNDDFLFRRNNVITIPFESKAELIQLVAEHIAFHYQKSFKNLKEKKPNEYRRRMAKSKKLVEALKILLNKKMRFFRWVTITNESKILKKAFEMVKIKETPESTISGKIIFKIRGMKFQIIRDKDKV